MMNFAGEPVRWKPLDHGIGIKECSIDFFRCRAQHAMKANGICGHDCSFQFGSCESHYRGLPFFGRPLSRLRGLVGRRRAGSTLPAKNANRSRLPPQVIESEEKARNDKTSNGSRNHGQKVQFATRAESSGDGGASSGIFWNVNISRMKYTPLQTRMTKYEPRPIKRKRRTAASLNVSTSAATTNTVIARCTGIQNRCNGTPVFG